MRETGVWTKTKRALDRLWRIAVADNRNPQQGSEAKGMITNPEQLQKFETELIKKEKVDVMRNFRLVDAMYREAIALGVIPLKDPLDGLEIDMKIARVVNGVSNTS
jgi:hypothetical protein